MIIIKKIIKAVSLVTIMSILTRLAGFLFRVTLSREIGAEGLALFQIAMSFFFVLVTFTSSGLPITVSRRVSKFRSLNDKKSINATVTASITIGITISLFLCVLFFVGKNLFSLMFADKRCVAMFICTIPAVILSSIYSSLRGGLWGENRYFWFSFVELMQEVLLLVSAIILVANTVTPYDGAMAASTAVSVSYVFATILVLVVYLLCGGRFASPKPQFAPLIKHSTPITGIRFAGTVEQSLIAYILPTMLMLSGLAKSDALAQYGVMMGMVMPLLFIPNTLIGSFAMVLIPEMAKLNLKTDTKQLGLATARAINFSILITGLFLPIYLGIGGDIASFLFKNELAGSYLTKACWLIIPFNLTQISSTLLNTLELERKSLRNYIIGVVLLIALTLILPRFYGINGFIISFGVSSSLTAILHIMTLKRAIDVENSIYKNLLYIILLSAPCSLLGFLVFSITSPFIPVFWCIALSAIFAFGATIFLYFIFNLLNMKNLKTLTQT